MADNTLYDYLCLRRCCCCCVGFFVCLPGGLGRWLKTIWATIANASADANCRQARVPRLIKMYATPSGAKKWFECVGKKCKKNGKEKQSRAEKKSKQYAYPAKDTSKDTVWRGRWVIVRVINDNPLYINFYRTQSRAKSTVATLYGSALWAKSWVGRLKVGMALKYIDGLIWGLRMLWFKISFHKTLGSWAYYACI